MVKRYYCSLLLILCFGWLHGQNLTFTQPVVFLKGATSDKAIDITNFRQHYFLTWKEAGTEGNIHARYLGEKMGTEFVIQHSSIPNAVSSYAPVFRTTDKNIYLFWIANDGSLKYIINTSETGFENATIHTLKCKQDMIFTKGISVSFVANKMVMASHGIKKEAIFIATSSIEDNGLLSDADVNIIPNASALDYPTTIAIHNATLARCCWSNTKDKNVSYSDYDPVANTWTQPASIQASGTSVTPILYRIFNNRLVFVWKNKKENRLSYIEASTTSTNDRPTLLPAYFNTNLPVSISYIDSNNFMMGYTGADNKLYLSYFSDYNPASWIGDLLFPTRAHYSLKDIVIPGSHDAGMSVLNGTGGSEHGVVNDCNTLTQTLNIKKQLNAGIRMFDLRLGVYKDELYTKHAPADCMEDAIAGGYGESLEASLYAVRTFLETNRKEFVILNFCHFCSKHASIEEQAKAVFEILGSKNIYYNPSQKLNDVQLKDIAGKVIVLFENYSYPQFAVDSGSMTDQSQAFINYRRAYAATNNLDHLLLAQQNFFINLKGNVHNNDLIRLDWQLTESGEEAALVCNDFQSDKTSPLLDGALLLTNTLKHNKSIIDLSRIGNRYLIPKIIDWMDAGIITKENKPNILYVDAAGAWITDFCIDLNNTEPYRK